MSSLTTNIRENPQPLALNQKNQAHLPPASKPDMQPVELEEEGSNQSFEKLKVKERPQQRLVSNTSWMERFSRKKNFDLFMKQFIPNS